MKTKILTYILDYTRKVLSSKYVKYGLIVVFSILVILASGPFVANQFANLLSNNNNHASAEMIWSAGSKISLYDKYVMYYNSGNALYNQNNMSNAVNKYEKAIAIAPESKICQIKWNTVMALVMLGKDNESADPTEAIKHYSRALFHLSYQSCLEDPQYADKLKLKAAELEQIIEKLNERLNEKRDNQLYRVDPDFKKPSEDDRSKAREDNILDSQQSQKSADSDKYSNEEKMEIYEKTWW